MSRRTWGHGLLSYLLPDSLGGICRVCGKVIERGPCLYRAWGVQKAHVACGWLRPDERDPHQLQGAEAPLAYEWACPTCGRDVVRASVTKDLRCTGCANPAHTSPEQRGPS